MNAQIKKEFKFITGFAFPPRATNLIEDQVVRKDQLFNELAHRVFDHPPVLETLLAYLPGWEKEEDSEEMAALCGYLFYLKEDYPAAAVKFLKTVSLNPPNLDNWVDLAFALNHCGNPLGLDILFNLPVYLKLYRENPPRNFNLSALEELYQEIRKLGAELSCNYTDFLTTK